MISNIRLENHDSFKHYLPNKTRKSSQGADIKQKIVIVSLKYADKFVLTKKGLKFRIQCALSKTTAFTAER